MSGQNAAPQVKSGGYRNDMMYRPNSAPQVKPGGYGAEDAGYGSWETPGGPPQQPGTQQPGTQQPGTQPTNGAPANAPTQTGGPEPSPVWAGGPGYGGPLQPSGPAYPGLGVQRPGNWYSVPFMQTYGGQPAPFADLSAQILNAMQMTGMGAGRFNANAAARYGYQGGTQQWRPDANPWGQPIQPYQWNPRAPIQPQQAPQGGAQPPMQTGGTSPAPGGGAGGAQVNPSNFGATFGRLMAENPQLAYMATNTGSAGNWLQQNQNQVRDQYFGGDQERYNQWANSSSPVGGNVDRTGFVDRLMALGLR